MLKEETAVKTAGKQRRKAGGRPFKPGQTGNPKGRPKGSISVTEAIKKKLLTCPPGEKRTYLNLLIIRILNMAIKEGDATLIKQIWAYMDGMPGQEIQAKISGAEGGPIEITVKYDEKRKGEGGGPSSEASPQTR